MRVQLSPKAQAKFLIAEKLLSVPRGIAHSPNSNTVNLRSHGRVRMLSDPHKRQNLMHKAKVMCFEKLDTCLTVRIYIVLRIKGVARPDKLRSIEKRCGGAEYIESV